MILAIKGRKVTLYERIDTGAFDEFNAPILIMFRQRLTMS